MKHLLLALVFVPVTALAHPGHGKPGFLHAHAADWLAYGALAFFAACVLGTACWAVLRVWKR